MSKDNIQKIYLQNIIGDLKRIGESLIKVTTYINLQKQEFDGPIYNFDK